jgi:hypothetical protein
MIEFEALAVTTDEEDGKAEPYSASFDKGITALPYSSKKIFDCLSFSFSDIVSGSLIIDGLEISAKNKQNGRIYELSVCVNEVADVIGVFSLPNGIKDSLAIQRDIGKEVRSLRALPVKSDEDKKAKLSSLLDVFSKNKASYVLIDLNDALNGQNPDVIKAALAGENLTAVVLESKPQENKIIPTLVQAKSAVGGDFLPIGLVRRVCGSLPIGHNSNLGRRDFWRYCLFVFGDGSRRHRIDLPIVSQKRPQRF